MNNALEATNELQRFLKELKPEDVSPIQDVGLQSTLQELFRKGANLDYLEKEREFYCIPNVFFSKRLIQLFLDRGSKVNSQDENGDTALHLAIRHCCYRGYQPAIKFLLENSADPNIPNLRGETALFTLAKKKIGSFQVGEWIWEVVQKLFERGADIKTRNKEGESILHLQKNDYYFCNRDDFIQRFDDFDLKTSSCFYSQTPLMIAARQDRLESCQLLIQRGADVNATDLQGYTALHHAVKGEQFSKCPKFLIDCGADVNAKSRTGKDPNQLLVLMGRYIFAYVAEPRKEMEIFEMAGAWSILYFRNWRVYGFWQEGMEVSLKSNIPPSAEFSRNFSLFLQNRINPDSDLWHEMYVNAIHTVARLSNTKESKFWNLLGSVPLDFNASRPYAFEIFVYLSEELKKVGDFASLEETDFQILSSLSWFFASWLKYLLDGPKIEINDNISHFHSIVSLAIACIELRIRETNSTKVLAIDSSKFRINCICLNLYSNYLNALALIRRKFDDVIPTEQLEHNERLLKALINLGLTDSEGNSWLHIALRTDKIFDIECLDVILDLGSTLNYIKAKNEAGIEPVQRINCNNEQYRKLLIKIADRGGHVDAKNVNPGGGKTLKEILEEGEKYSSFQYDTLQCTCARALVRSLVPFRNKVPKRMVDFILMHG